MRNLPDQPPLESDGLHLLRALQGSVLLTRQQFDAEVVRLADAGMPASRMARACGMSHPGIIGIYEKATRRPWPRRPGRPWDLERGGSK